MMSQIKRILYATDLSPNSLCVLRYAIHEAIEHNAEIIILHVFESEDSTSQAVVGLHFDEIQRQKISAEHTAEVKELIKKKEAPK